MMDVHINRLGIIGQGLIGSSITRAVRDNRLANEIVVTDVSPRVRNRLRELGLAQVVDSNRAVVENADVVFLCVPVSQCGTVVAEVASHLKPSAILTDVGSVKESVVRDVTAHLPQGVHFVPGHPLAGTEHSGPDAGLADLFVKRWCILTPTRGTDPNATQTIKAIWEAVGSKVELMSVKQHDRVLAITSHLPHLIAFTIFDTAAREEQLTNSDVIRFSAGGFRDFTRIAASNPSMWRDVFLGNKTAVLDVLKEFTADIQSLAKAIESNEGQELVDRFSRSRHTRREVIEKGHQKLSSEIKQARKEKPTVVVRPYGSID